MVVTKIVNGCDMYFSLMVVTFVIAMVVKSIAMVAKNSTREMWKTIIITIGYRIIWGRFPQRRLALAESHFSIILGLRFFGQIDFGYERLDKCIFSLHGENLVLLWQTS